MTFGPQDMKYGLTATPEDAEKEVKERQGQNWSGKNLLPNFSMKINVAPFVFTNNLPSMKNLIVVYNLGSL